MGHLTRQTSIALALGQRARVTILSLSSGISAVAEQGIPVEYLPSYQRPWIPWTMWNNYLSDRLTALIDETDATVVVFDGVAPYRGLVLARRTRPDVTFVWFRRGMWRRGRNKSALRAEPFFDLTIEPGDVATPSDQGYTRTRVARKIEPVSVLDVQPLLPRQEAVSALGLDPERRIGLVTLGSGAIGDNGKVREQALDIFVSAGWQVATTQAALSANYRAGAHVVVLTDVYPLARFANAFDVVISEAGYNATHEFLQSSARTILVPNEKTATDDQVSRAEYLDLHGAVTSVRAHDSSKLREAIEAAMYSVEHQTERLVQPVGPYGGSLTAADILLALTSVKTDTNTDVVRRLRRVPYIARIRATQFGEFVLGPATTDRIRQYRRKSPGLTERLRINLAVDFPMDIPVTLHATPIDLQATPATMTMDLSKDDLSGTSPFEHVLKDSSQHYHERRLEILLNYYDVASVSQRRLSDS